MTGSFYSGLLDVQIYLYIQHVWLGTRLALARAWRMCFLPTALSRPLVVCTNAYMFALQAAR